jgi:hypothetical protein
MIWRLLVSAMLLIFAIGWIREHDARTRAEAEGRRFADLATEQALRAGTLERRQQQLAADAARQIAALEKQRREHPPLQQVIRQIPELVPGVQPQAVQQAPAASARDEVLPQAPSAAMFDESALRGLRDFALKCRECAVERDSLQAQLETAQQARAAREEEAEAQRQRAEAAERGLHGGSRFSAVARTLKCAAVAGLGGAVGSAVAGARGAAIGGASGVVACSIF